MKIPRGNTNGVGDDEVTVSSGLHAPAERAKKQREKRKLVRKLPVHPVVRRLRQKSRTG